MNQAKWISLFFLAGGLGLALSLGAEVLHARQSRSWPTVPGTITTSQDSVLQDADAPVAIHYADVRYRYTVAGVTRTGRRIRFGPHIIAPRDVAQALQRYPAGQTVPVFYFPGWPGRSTLETGTHGLYTLFLPLAVALSALSLAFGLSPWRHTQIFRR